jgi:hypothetical protein
MTSDDPVFKAVNDVGIDDMPVEAAVARRMLRRLEDIDDPATPAQLRRLHARRWCAVSSRTQWSNSRPKSSN